MIKESENIQRLRQWCQDNFLALIVIDNLNQFSIKNFGKFLLILPKGGKVIDRDNFSLLVEENEREVIEKNEVEYLCFEFGGRFYYCKPKLKKDQYNEMVYDPDFNDLKYIGEPDIQLTGEWCHLGIHSEYELLNGSHNADDWVKKAKFLGLKTLGLCDKNTLAGVLNFQKSCVKNDIKPIIGSTVKIAYNFDPDKDIQETYEVKLYAANESGWRNLLRIMRVINVEIGYDYIPEEMLLEFTEGLILVFNNDSYINEYKDKSSISKIKQYKGLFEDVLYQIDTVEYEDDETDIKHLKNIQNYLKNYSTLIDPILINDSYYIDKEECKMKNSLNKIGKIISNQSEEQHFKTLDESYIKMFDLFEDEEKFNVFFERCVNNTVELSKSCVFKYETGKARLPKYEFSNGVDNVDLFMEQIELGFQKKLSYLDELEVQKYQDRLEKELNVIVPANLVDYFLILWDIVNWCRSQDIMVGPGRGSVVGSLISYCLDITDVDPIKYNLLFERFINETRVSGERAKSADAMPDVDLDFQASDRDRVKNYISDRFGRLYTCSIGAYGRLQLKGAIKDFSRVKGLRHSFVNFITKHIEFEIDYHWKDLFLYSAKHPELYEFVQNNPDIVHLVKYSLNQCRSASIHASAVIIVPKEKDGERYDIFDWMPMRLMEGKLVSEWEGKSTDSAGFLKEDILALSQLDKFQNIIKLVKKNRGINLKLHKIKFDDPKVYELFHEGYNEDVFQFNSTGLKSYSRFVKPDGIEDLIAMNALYRPGPMGSNAHNDFALIKHGKKKPEYDFGLKEVTKNTNSLYIYQEQIMQAVVVLGGFSLVESDQFRTNIKKFDKEKMAESKDKFIKGALERGCSKEQAEKIWSKLLAFGGYGFNRSHSAAYTFMTYWSQYLKVYYPLEFWTTSIQLTKKDTLIPKRMSEMHKINRKIKVKPPHINNSELDFVCKVEENSIYWSLSKIKNVGASASNAIIGSRKERLFKGYEDFVNRVPKNKVNRSVVTSLILAGCFDELEGVQSVIERHSLLKRHYRRIGAELPEEYQDESVIRKPYFWIFKQRELTGLGDVDYKQLLKNNKQIKQDYIDLYHNPDKFFDAKDYTEAVVCGKVISITERKYKNKPGKLANMILYCNNEEIQVTLWNDFIEDNVDMLAESINKVISISGKIKYDSHYSGVNVLYSTDDSKIFEL